MRTHMLVTVAAALVMLGAGGARLDAQAATTVCKDGSTSTATGKGACSGHGGVDSKATSAAKKAATAKSRADAKAAKAAKVAKAETRTESKAEAKAAKAEAKTETKAAAQVTCADGSTSTAGRGACSGHGGVKKAAVATAAPSLPAAVPATAPARTKSEAKSQAPAAKQQASNRGEDNDATGAIAQCKDGLYSHATNRRGACSKHGGVAKWLKS